MAARMLQQCCVAFARSNRSQFDPLTFSFAPQDPSHVPPHTRTPARHGGTRDGASSMMMLLLRLLQPSGIRDCSVSGLPLFIPPVCLCIVLAFFRPSVFGVPLCSSNARDVATSRAEKPAAFWLGRAELL